MTGQVEYVRRMDWPGMVTEYASLGCSPWPTTTRAHQVGVGFSGHRRMLREFAGRVERRDAVPGAVYVTAETPIGWLEVAEPVEALEIYPRRALVEEVAGGPVEIRPGLELHDAVVFGIAARLRRAHLVSGAVSPMEGEVLGDRLISHLVDTYSPVRLEAAAGLLGRAAVRRVGEYVRDHLGEALTIGELAAVVPCSRFHFARSFRATTGLAPHAFVTEQRLVVARDAVVRARTPVVEIAAAVGFSNVSHFRRLFRRRFGVTPGELRR